MPNRYELPVYYNEGIPELSSMEKGRNLRDYALAAGFNGRKDILSYINSYLDYDDAIIEFGCGEGKASREIARYIRKKMFSIML